MKKVNPKKSKRNSGRNGAVERSGTEAVRPRHFIPGFRVRAATSVATAIAVVIISVLTIFTIVKAGNITPPSGAPSAKFYTLSEIYNFITSNTTATEGDHSFTFSDGLSSTHRTLTEIYDSLKNLISADKVKLGTTYLNVAGTLTPDGGAAGVADLFNSKTAHLTNDWNLDTGTLNLACDTATFNGTLNLVADGYDGAGIGNNRWCTTDSGDAAASEMKTGKIAWVDGIAITGSGTQTLSADNQTVAAGYYSATTLSAVDSDLAVGNIKSGVDIFGVSGSLITNPLFGDDIASNVLTTAANRGTYDAATCGTVYNTSNLSAGNIKNGTAFGVGLIGEYPSASYPLPGNTDTNAATGNILTGYEAWDKAGTHISGAMVDRAAASYTPSNVAQTIAAGYYNGSGTVATDANLITGNILSGKIIFGVPGKTEVVDTTEAATPIVADMVLANKVGFVNGSKITGSLATRTLSADNQTVTAGYYEATTLSAVDSNLAVGNIRSGVDIFGFVGNFNVVDTSTGDATASEILSGYKAWVDGAEIAGNASSGYPGTGWTGSPAISQSTCDVQNDNGWYWFEDGNGDGDTADPEDGVCVKTTAGTAGSWNGYKYTTNYDNTYIAAYTCSGSFPSGTVATYSGLDSAGNPDTTWNDGDCALCQADCYDGQKDLPDQGGYTSNPGGSGGYYGPITPEILKEWKGTRLPTANDFFGFCGATNGDADSTAGDSAYHSSGASADTTIGNYGKNVGRGTSSEYMYLSNSENYEWLSEQHNYNIARVAGFNGCSYFHTYNVFASRRFRAVFRP